MVGRSRVAFAFPVWRASQVWQGALLARSVARFGGALAGSPVRAYAEASIGAGLDALSCAGCAVSAFEVPPGLRGVPFAAKCAGAAAAEAEEAGGGSGGILVWMDPDSLVLAEPTELAIPPGIDIALRPVDHANVGSPASAPPDDFWSALYDAGRLSPSDIWHVRGTVDGTRLRGYFNAGLLAARPEAGILRGWLRSLQAVASDPRTPALLEGDPRRSVFLHQAVLACEVMSRVPEGRARLLPESYNFPVHMRAGHPMTARPGAGAVTVRYGDEDGDGSWMDEAPLSPEARDWVKSSLKARKE